MLIGEFDALLEAKPFRPFDLITADGRAVRIKSPEFAWHPPNYVRTVWVATDESECGTLIDLHYVTQAVFGSRGTSNGKKKRRTG